LSVEEGKIVWVEDVTKLRDTSKKPCLFLWVWPDPVTVPKLRRAPKTVSVFVSVAISCDRAEASQRPKNRVFFCGCGHSL
jgi:hypothetical protein